MPTEVNFQVTASLRKRKEAEVSEDRDDFTSGQRSQLWHSGDGYRLYGSEDGRVIRDSEGRHVLAFEVQTDGFANILSQPVETRRLRNDWASRHSATNCRSPRLIRTWRILFMSDCVQTS